ncbi:MAG: response regulator [Alphaproteobacteria bacterium]|nr:MAG: response regulator [Alphaproteobacteria bacterium]
MARALFIEDDKSLPNTLVDLLRINGFTVDIASSQRDIYIRLDAADSDAAPYDVILTDDCLKSGTSRMRGIEIYNVIRHDSALPTVPIIAGSQDLCFWEGIRCTSNDANLYPAAKLSRSGNVVWDDTRTLDILAVLGFIPAHAPA